MSNTVDMTRVEKYFSQLVRVDKLSQLDSRSCRVENASHYIVYQERELSCRVVQVDKLSRPDRQSCRVENASH